MPSASTEPPQGGNHAKRPLDAKATPKCRKCKCALTKTTVITADVDQAFEACEQDPVMESWGYWQKEFEKTQAGNPSEVYVKTGKKNSTTLAKRPRGRGWWCVHADHIRNALLEFTKQTYACIGSLVVAIAGLPIGAVLSSLAVSALLGYQEAKFLEQAHPDYGIRKGRARDEVMWLRYVDDALAASNSICPKCLYELITQCYTLKLSPCSGLPDKNPEGPHVWVDVQIIVIGFNIYLEPKNVARAWSRGMSAVMAGGALQWYGRPPFPSTCV